MSAQTITLDEYRAWAATATRNLTDDAIGASTVGRRRAAARHSRLIEARPSSARRMRQHRQRTKENAAREET